MLQLLSHVCVCVCGQAAPHTAEACRAGASAAMLAVHSTLSTPPPAKRLRGKQPGEDAATAAARFADLATAEELAHPDVKFAGAGVRRKHIHWTHGRSANPAHIQPCAMTRAQFWSHLEKVYKEVYPAPGSPTGSILAFGLVAQEPYATTAPGVCPTHKHAPTFNTEQHFWNKVARHSLDKYGVKLNAVAHDSYLDMYNYVRTPTAKKPVHTLDSEPYFSKHHPKDDALSTLLAACSKSSTLHRARWGGRAGGAPGPTRDRAPRLFEVVREHDFRTVTALEAFACKEATEGRGALAELCTKQAGKLRGLLDGARSVLDAPQRLLELNLTRLDKLRRVAVDRPCKCGGAWQPGAHRILGLNDIDVGRFCSAMCRALDLGARRDANIGCIGAAGCGKSTLIEPFETIFRTLAKPQRGSTFPLGKLPVCDVILWQDFEHHEETLAFTDLLSVFCGEAVELREPGKVNEKYRNQAPLFYSGRVPLRCSRADKTAQEVLNGMMSERFQTFQFFHPLPKPERKADWVHCAKCCAAFYLRGAPLPPGSAASPPVTPATCTTALAAAATVAPTAPASTSAVALPTVGATVAAVAAPIALASTLPATAAASGPPPLPCSTPGGAVGPAVVEALQQLHALHATGALDDAEFARAKRAVLGM